MSAYYEIPELAGVYLEDSFVLGIEQSEDQLVFDLNVVLTQDHPDYHGPKQNEQYDYRRGRLTFIGAQAIQWSGTPLKPAVDASGETDFGSIDDFTYIEHDFAVSGDFGTVRLVAESVQLSLGRE